MMFRPDFSDTMIPACRDRFPRCDRLTQPRMQIERLRLIIKTLQRSQFGRQAERLDDDQPRLGFEDFNADLARAESKLPPTRGKPPRALTERPSLPAHLPSEDVRLDLGHQTCLWVYARDDHQTRSYPSNTD
jgi:transposase